MSEIHLTLYIFLFVAANILIQQLGVLPSPTKNVPNTQTEVHIKTRITLTLNTPINQCECFLIMTVFQRWGKLISYICMQICCWSHDVNNASCYQLLQGDCWEQLFLAEDVGCWMSLRRTVTQTSLTVMRDKESACPRPPQIYITLSSSASPPFHLSISPQPRAPDLNSSLFFLYDWEIYNPINTYTPYPPPPSTNTQKLAKKTHTVAHAHANKSVCAIAPQTAHLMWKCARGKVLQGGVLGQLTWGFLTCERSWTGCYFLPREEGLLFINPLASACFVFALSWSRKFLTLQSPLPSLHVKASHFSQKFAKCAFFRVWLVISHTNDNFHAFSHVNNVCLAFITYGLEFPHACGLIC